MRSASLDDVSAFFATYYQPRNASIAIAGDVDASRALATIRDYFEEIEPGPPVPPVIIDQPALSEPVRLLLEDRVELPRLYLAWHSPRFFADGDAELDLLADLLANGKTSRLYRVLVYERRIATDVAAAQNSRELSGFFQLAATAAPGRTLEELDTVIAAELSAVLGDGPTADELARSAVEAEASFLYRLQAVGGFGGKSDQLNSYNVFTGDPGYLARDRARYQRVSPESMLRVAAECLRPERRVALSVVPVGQSALGLPGSRPAVVA